MRGATAKALRHFALEQLARVPVVKPRRRPWWRRALDWCCGIEPAPRPDPERLAMRNTKSQYRNWRRGGAPSRARTSRRARRPASPTLSPAGGPR